MESWYDSKDRYNEKSMIAPNSSPNIYDRETNLFGIGLDYMLIYRIQMLDTNIKKTLQKTSTFTVKKGFKIN
jgi:hypothetical protein